MAAKRGRPRKTSEHKTRPLQVRAHSSAAMVLVRLNSYRRFGWPQACGQLLQAAIAAVGSWQRSLADLPDDWKAPKPLRRNSIVGKVVLIKDHAKPVWSEIVGDGHHEVQDARAGLICLAGLDGEKVWLPRGHVQIV